MPDNGKNGVLTLATFRYSLPLGEIIIQFPEPLPADQLDFIDEWMKLMVRRIARAHSIIAIGKEDSDAG